jgi:hypothetical protein
MTVPLKLKDSASADFVQFSSTEENYLAYQAGLHLASGDSSDVGSLALNSHGTSTTIGSFTDTSYDQPVGTGGDNVSLTFSTTTTPVLQTKGTLTPSGSNNRLPVMFRDSDGQTVIREMNDSDMSVMIDRINTRIFTSDYPGTYKLATSTPTGGYTLDVANVTTDTRTDGTSNQHNLYRRTSMTAPTKVLPFSIKRSSGDTGTYQGLQLMSDDQVKYSIGTRLQNKISSTTNGVGSYKIYSSAAGTPTSNGLSGTWTAKGTATDTRQAIVNANYTRGRTSTYARLRTSTYSAEYQRTRSSAFSRSSNVARTSTYSATYTKTRVSTYTVSGFLGNFIGDYARATDKDYTRTSTRDVAYVGNYGNTFTANYSRLFEYTGNFGSSVRSSTVVSAYTGNYTNDFVGNYTRQAQYIGNYTGDFADTYTRDRQAIAGATYSRIFTGNYARAYTRNRDSNYSSNYLRTSILSFEGNYQRNRVENFTGDYTRNFSRDFSSDFTRTSINEMGYQTAYVRGRAKGGFQYYVGNFTGLAYYSRNTITSAGSWSSYTFNTNFGSLAYWFTPPTSSTVASQRAAGWTPQNQDDPPLQSELGAPYYSNQARTFFFIYWDDNELIGTHAWNNLYANDACLFSADPPNGGTGVAVGQYQQISEWSGSGTMPTYDEVQAMNESDRIDFVRDITRIVKDGYEYEKGSFSGLRNSNDSRGTYYDGHYHSIRRRLITAGTTPAEYASSFVGNYSRVTRTSTRSSNYTRTSTTSYEGNYLRNSTLSYEGNYARNFTRTFVGNYSRNFTRTRQSNYLGGEGYTRDFVGNFTGNYTRDFTATFEGNYSRNYVGNFIGNYGRNFLGNYNRTFTGNYTGEQIGSGSTNIETYTLYVRTA